MVPFFLKFKIKELIQLIKTCNVSVYANMKGGIVYFVK